MRKWILLTVIPLLFVAFSLSNPFSKPLQKAESEPHPKTRTATFAGGCFWCVESDFEEVPGVIEALSGYTGGNVSNPNYRQVSAGGTGHAEAVQVLYDPVKVSYEQLLNVFWRHVDPTDAGGQFVDRGSQYRTAIFYHDEEQKRLAEKSKAALRQSGRFDKPIVTEIVKADTFYTAEDYHQDYYKTHSLRYKFYRYNSGRDQFLKRVWGKKDTSGISPAQHPRYAKPSDDILKQKLTPLQYKVTQREGTEPPFRNTYWDNKEDGIYVDIVSGEPLFSSLDKFASGTGWPSFTKPLVPDNIVEKADRTFFMVRTEIRSKHGDSHLGHVFPDGPAPTGLRYCINSASLWFVPKEQLEQEGYGEFVKLFSQGQDVQARKVRVNVRLHHHVRHGAHGLRGRCDPSPATAHRLPEFAVAVPTGACRGVSEV